MSILINGMEMPKEDYFSIVYIYGDGKVKMPVWGKGMQFVDGVNAIPIPPHGRLIDADALEPDTDWWHGCDGYTAFSRCAIECAPTIIPAEEGE